MPYKVLLNQKIEQSKLSIKEIAKRCNEYGVKITAAYISTLKNNEDKIPSDQVSKALAHALNIDERLLIIEAYIDKAPKEFVSFINTIRAIIVQSVSMMFEKAFDKDTLKVVIDNLNTLPIAEFVLQMKDYPLDGFTKSKDYIKSEGTLDKDNFHFLAELKEPLSFNVDDNAMFPLMSKGSKATIEAMNLSDYKNGDILYIMKDKKGIFRKCYFVDVSRAIINLIPLNQDYEMQTVNMNEITILGKVKRLITSFE